MFKRTSHLILGQAEDDLFGAVEQNMHVFDRFVAGLGPDWPSRVNDGPRIVLSQASMPDTPEILIVPPY